VAILTRYGSIKSVELKALRPELLAAVEERLLALSSPEPDEPPP